MKNLYGVDINLTPEREKLMAGGWEYHRIMSMMANVKEGDVIFDIGAEQGDMSVLLGKKTGKIVLFEASPIMWTHIRENFERNDLKPLGCYAGFASDVTDENPEGLNYKDKDKDGYPECAYDELKDVRSFRHLSQETSATKQITIDDYCKRTGIYPDMITMDVEGSEYNVLQGIKEVLAKRTVVIYISIHHDFLFHSYGKFFNDIVQFFHERGYKTEYLGFDHEAHFVFYRKSLIILNEIL